VSARGYLGLVLHAHLPFVRHPEHEDFLEEDWLFEAITETYVPLFAGLLRLRDEGVPFHLAISVSPPLVAMLDDPLLRSRYRRHLGRLLTLAESECRGNAETTAIGRAARHYAERFRMAGAFLETWRGDLLGPLRALQNGGLVEILACNATHGFLPLMSSAGAQRAQLRAGVSAHTRAFGRRPRGMWLAECGYDHHLDQVLTGEGIEFFFLDGQALEMGRPAPRRGLFAPVRTPAGPVAFPRDHETGRQVWSAQEGYPGDPVYREFYRDVGWDAGYDYIRPYLHEDGVRRGVGLKYHRVTGPGVALHDKELYDPPVAEERAREHARDFVANRVRQIAHHAGWLDRPPLVVAPYDAELFGHWWYEGPIFLEEVLREIARSGELATLTPSQYLARHGEGLETARPNPSTWGAESTNRVWLNDANAWLYRYQHWAEREMQELVRAQRAQGPRAPGLAARALKQAGRELLLMQSSDWAFILAAGTTAPYAARRVKQHFLAFRRLRDQLRDGTLKENEISALEAMAPLFPDLDVSAWG
jgi:1,4-alpha-glucan branching enzyme